MSDFLNEMGKIALRGLVQYEILKLSDYSLEDAYNKVHSYVYQFDESSLEFIEDQLLMIAKTQILSGKHDKIIMLYTMFKICDTKPLSRYIIYPIEIA